MTPVSPVLPGYQYSKEREVVIAKDQKPYIPLPMLRTDGDYTLSRWKLTWKERIQVLLGGNVWLWVITPFTKPYPPVKLQATEPK